LATLFDDEESRCRCHSSTSRPEWPIGRM
jgi:hypothetical protein